MVKREDAEIPFDDVVCLMSGGIDSSIAAWYLCQQPARTVWPLYVRRRAAAETHELKALKRILPWLRAHCRGRVERLKAVMLAYPPPELKPGYPRRIRDRFGYAGRETMLCHVAVCYALSLGRPSAAKTAVATGSLAHDLFPHNSPRFWKQVDKLLRIELGDEAIPVVHPLQAGSLLGPATKADVVRYARQIDFPLHWARSCIADSKRPCGQCLECHQREEAESSEPN
jgi:7-cyano-7-deazaguanine synthase in queuosine biosynthesis